MSLSDTFKQDVIKGLSATTKKISSKYFYDEKGDKIFQEIMKMPEYYLPEAELDIIHTKASIIASLLQHECDIVELGAGDGTKTRYLLSNLIKEGIQLTYYPLDISPAVLVENKANVKAVVPSIDIHPLAGDYFNTIKQIDTHKQKVLLFLGSNIGNFDESSSISFLSLIKDQMKDEDLLVLATDLRKNPNKIKLAYDDPHGITRRFNLNLLERINRELEGSIDLALWDHYTHYDPIRGIVASYLVSTTHQTFMVAGQDFNIKKHELIHTEVSRKYDLEQVQHLGQEVGFNCTSQITDAEGGFAWSFFKR